VEGVRLGGIPAGIRHLTCQPWACPAKVLHVLNYCDSLAAWTGPRVRGGVAHGLSAELGSFIHLPGVSWLLNVAVWWVRIPGELPLDVG
jgi:hypothetical protein